jgi:hypothetical protein
MHKGHYSDSYYVLARFMVRFARSLATISIVFRVYVTLIIDPWIDHLQDHPMGLNPLRWYIYLGLYTHEVGWPSDMY